MKEIIRRILIRGSIYFGIWLYLLFCICIGGSEIFDSKYFFEQALSSGRFIGTVCIVAIIFSCLWHLIKPKLEKCNFMEENLHDVMINAICVAFIMMLALLFVGAMYGWYSISTPMKVLSIFIVLVLSIIGSLAFVAAGYYWKKLKSTDKK
jgi:Na+/H+-dicarboxylate symporter